MNTFFKYIRIVEKNIKSHQDISENGDVKGKTFK